MNARLAQIWTIARLQLGRVFFSKRSIWIFGLAIFPTIIFIGHGIDTKVTLSRLSQKVTPAAVLESIQDGDTDEEVLKRAGDPSNDFSYNDQPGFSKGRRRNFGKDKNRSQDDQQGPTRRYMMYFDGARRWNLDFEDGILQNKRNNAIANLEEDRRVFAAVFQFYYLRLAVFFGCLGIFTNLFRGEMQDKTLHFWFLAPVRREVLLAGKYLAGLIAALVIFTAGAALSYIAMLWAQDPAQASAFWHDQGASQLGWYAASTAMGCLGYGSVFLAAGLLLKNPIIPAIVIEFWEGINGILPAALQKLSILYYAQSLSPVPVPMDADAPLLIRLLTSPAEPPPVLVAILGLLAVTAIILWIASRAVRKIEINYGTE